MKKGGEEMFIIPTDQWLIFKSKSYELKPQQERVIRRLLTPLVEQSPCSSSFIINIEKSDGGYVGGLKVKSRSHSFFVKSYEDTVEDLCKDLKMAMIQEIEKWRETRNLLKAV